MLRFISFLLCFLFFFLNGQHNVSTYQQVDNLIQEAEIFNEQGKQNDVISTLNKAIDLSESKKYDKGTIAARKLLMDFYYQQSDNENVLQSSIELEKLALKLKDYKTLSSLYKNRAIAYEYLGFTEKTKQEYALGLKYTNLIPDQDYRHYNLSLLYYNMAVFYQDSSEQSLSYLKIGLKEINSVKDNSESISAQKKEDMLISFNTNLGMFYKQSKNKLKDENLAEVYLKEALNIIEKSKFDIDKSTKIDLYATLAELYLGKKEYRKAVKYSEDALALEKSYRMIYNRRVTYMVLAKSYLGLDDSKSSKEYLSLFTKINDSINSVEKAAVEKPIKQIISEEKINNAGKINRIIIFTLILFLVLIIIGWLLWLRNEKKLHKKYEEVIAKISHKEENILANEEIKEPKPLLGITEEVSKDLLQKLEKFEKSEKYLRKDISLAWLANHLDTNVKYLSEAIKTHRDTSFSNYINGLKINYIIGKLYQNPIYREYKINYLAEECGFSTPRVFLNAFKKETDLTPSYFIKELQNEKVS